MNNQEHLEQLEQRLDQMLSKQKEKKNRTFVAKYKGENIRTGSGKSSWKAVNHAKAALLLHFSHLEHQYVYDYINRVDCVWNKFSSYEINERRKQFREKLWEMIKIVELE
jgi:hypothetical protein